MIMQVTSSNPTFGQSTQHSMQHNNPVAIPSQVQETIEPEGSEILTPEQQGEVQKVADDKISEQVNNVKSNFETAKNIDLMQLYYNQQQKLFDIYMQSSNSDSTTVSSTQSQSTSAVSSLATAYSELYKLHNNIKDGVSNLPSIEQPEILPVESQGNVATIQGSTMQNALSNKQLESYNNLMMPSTSNYVHLSA